MKKTFKLFLFLSGLPLLIAGFSSPSMAADSAAFDPFWNKFKAAVQQRDKGKVASMVKFPFATSAPEFDAKDPTGFSSKYDALMTPAVKKAISEGKHQFLPETGAYQLNCALKLGPGYLMFERVGGVFKWVDVGYRE